VIGKTERLFAPGGGYRHPGILALRTSYEYRVRRIQTDKPWRASTPHTPLLSATFCLSIGDPSKYAAKDSFSNQNKVTFQP
jgi:hypothetical protein